VISSRQSERQPLLDLNFPSFCEISQVGQVFMSSSAFDLVTIGGGLGGSSLAVAMA
jgi:hypothetical protein